MPPVTATTTMHAIMTSADSAKLVPLAGGAAGGTFDGATCYLVGQAADRAFRQTADTTGIDARIDTAVAALQTRIDIRTANSKSGSPSGWSGGSSPAPSPRPS